MSLVSTRTTDASRTRTALAGMFLGLGLALSGCDGGGAAGDDALVGQGPNRVEPFVGLWDITGNWKGLPNDLAYLSIRPINENEHADAVVFDFDDDGANCAINPTLTGDAVESADQRVFLNHPDFTDGIMTLDSSGNRLTIMVTDSRDVDGDGNLLESQPITGTRLLGDSEQNISICTDL